MYIAVMAVIAAPIAMQSTFPLGLGTLMVIVFLAGLAAAGYFIGCWYVDSRPSKHHWR
jgi:hypothetical protein